MRPGPLLLSALLLWVFQACSAGPDLPKPSGRRFDVWVLDAKRLEVEGKPVPIGEFVEAMRVQAENARKGRGQAPYVVINLRPIKAPGFLDRLMTDLHRAGVRAIDIQD
jgi:hypothetical protein